jgi:Protein of unknown function (DUF2924)
MTAPASDQEDEIAHLRDLDLSGLQAGAQQTSQPQAQSELLHKIGGLADLTSQQLREEWRRLYRSQPPRLSRDLLIRTVAYRMQELAYGGPSKATMRKLQSLAKDLELNGSLACEVDHSVRPGMRLVREWRGRLHTVIVTQEGFEFAEKHYASLSKIAHAITSAHWSGPRFFGLSRSRASTADPSGRVGGEGSSHD